MSDGGTEDRTVQHIGQHDVVDILALAANEPWVFLALEAAKPDRAVGIAGCRVGGTLFDDGHAFTSSSLAAAAGCSAAHCTERTMVA